MFMAAILLTKEKRKELEDELHEMQVHGRKDIALKIAEARSHGDLSENADYDAAKDAQGMLELKISKIAATLANCQVIDLSEFPDGVVHILSKVKIKNLKTGRISEYTLVSDAEADYEKGKLSTASPLGKCLLAKKLGEIADMNLPTGIQQFEILDIA
jgi:transcription elongation factor GreA